MLRAVTADSNADASAVYYEEGYRVDAEVVASLIEVWSERALPLPRRRQRAPVTPTHRRDPHRRRRLGPSHLLRPHRG